MSEEIKRYTREEYQEIRKLIKKAIDGEEVKCPHCGAILIYYRKGSGMHPGIFCPNKDFEVLMEMK